MAYCCNARSGTSTCACHTLRASSDRRSAARRLGVARVGVAHDARARIGREHPFEPLGGVGGAVREHDHAGVDRVADPHPTAVMVRGVRVFVVVGVLVMTDGEVVRINEMRASILDYLEGDLDRFSKSLGTSDRARIDAHLTSIRELELQLQVAGTAPAGGTTPPPTLEPGINVDATGNFAAVTDMQMRLSAAAFAADVTRVIVLQLGDQGGSNIVITPLGFDPNNTQKEGNTGLVQGLHVIAHDNVGDKLRTDGWFQEQIANMIQLLKDNSDPTGPVFENTVLLVEKWLRHQRRDRHERRRRLRRLPRHGQRQRQPRVLGHRLRRQRGQLPCSGKGRAGPARGRGR